MAAVAALLNLASSLISDRGLNHRSKSGHRHRSRDQKRLSLLGCGDGKHTILDSKTRVVIFREDKRLDRFKSEVGHERVLVCARRAGAQLPGNCSGSLVKCKSGTGKPALSAGSDQFGVCKVTLRAGIGTPALLFCLNVSSIIYLCLSIFTIFNISINSILGGGLVVGAAQIELQIF